MSAADVCELEHCEDPAEFVVGFGYCRMNLCAWHAFTLQPVPSCFYPISAVDLLSEDGR